MDGLTLIGMIIAFGAIFLGQTLEGGEIHTLMNLSAILIVLGGTLGAVMVQTPLQTFKRALQLLPCVFKSQAQPYDKMREKIVDLARKSRQYGLLSLEDQIETETNPIMRKGLELLVVGVDKITARQVLESEIDRREAFDLQAARVFDAMGGYSPTIGILGAVIGLIQVMRNLADPGQLGAGIAVAFVATIYGVGLANLLFLPIGNKLKGYIHSLSHLDDMIVEGIVCMAGGESPHLISIKLNNFGKIHEKKTTRSGS